MPAKVVSFAGRKVEFVDLDPDDLIERTLLEGHWYEEDVLRFIHHLNVSGDYLDAGAYIGNHSIFFSLFCPSHYVFAFEPQPHIYDKLRNNLRVNGIEKCVAMKAALSDTLGRVRIASPDAYNRGMATFTEDTHIPEVPIWTVDHMVRDIKLMKVDVEGMEMNVLRGAEKTLEGVEHLFVEIPPNFRKQDEIVKFLIPKRLHLTEVFPDEQIYYFRRTH